MEDLGLPRKSFLANLKIDNHNNVIDTFVDDKVLINVDIAEATNIVGDKGVDFFLDAK